MSIYGDDSITSASSQRRVGGVGLRLRPGGGEFCAFNCILVVSMEVEHALRGGCGDVDDVADDR
jgi:hypothetical protein